MQRVFHDKGCLGGKNVLFDAPRMTILSISSGRGAAAPWPRPRARKSRGRGTRSEMSLAAVE